LNPFRGSDRGPALPRPRWRVTVEPFVLRAATLGCGGTCLFRAASGQPVVQTLLSSALAFLLVCVLGLRVRRAP